MDIIPHKNNEDAPANKNMDTQPRFYSTKKRYQKSKVRLTFYRIIKILYSTTYNSTEDRKKILWFASKNAVQALMQMGQQIPVNVRQDVTDLPEEVIEADITSIKEFFEDTAWDQVLAKELRKSWTCSNCKIAAHTNMIECDGCALWYNWSCAGIKGEPKSWYCKNCNPSDKKRKMH
ncbi:unnamed protein product [Porites lobata]|uniref:Zinc finger PHD-type domain-containing protein n=1 Tax=Porites lobata TaxID=104759 RepID=A0ABN8RK84_9CNID|nr:unnamed protein product [Porites lobata]